MEKIDLKVAFDPFRDKIENFVLQNYKNGEKKKPRKKKKGGPKFSDQLGVKVSWSTWQWRQGQEKFHKENFRK